MAKPRRHEPTGKSKTTRFGQLEPQYNFALNPYPDQRMSKCPNCGQKTGQRKVPLIIHVDPLHLNALGYTCRYCPRCDLLIGHKHEIEHLLAQMILQRDPSAIGNDYFIIGTAERKAWRESLRQPKTVVEMRAFIHDFKSSTIVQMSRGGWFPRDQEPPLAEPPPSMDWVKLNDG